MKNKFSASAIDSIRWLMIDICNYHFDPENPFQSINSKTTTTYQKFISTITTNSSEFYTLMETKRTSKTSLPIVMKYNGKFHKGDQWITIMMEHLQSCFIESNLTISNDFILALRQIDDKIYHTYSLTQKYLTQSTVSTTKKTLVQ